MSWYFHSRSSSVMGLCNVSRRFARLGFFEVVVLGAMVEAKVVPANGGWMYGGSRSISMLEVEKRGVLTKVPR